MIAALAKTQQRPQNFNLYIGPQPRSALHIIPDDLGWARRVGKLLDTDYHEIMLSPTCGPTAKTCLSHGRAVADPQ